MIANKTYKFMDTVDMHGGRRWMYHTDGLIPLYSFFNNIS